MIAVHTSCPGVAAYTAAALVLPGASRRIYGVAKAAPHDPFCTRMLRRRIYGVAPTSHCQALRAESTGSKTTPSFEFKRAQRPAEIYIGA